MSVTVVIATRNRRETLLGSLARLRALPDRPRLLVVDNGSTDGTPLAVRTAFPEATLVALEDNLGAFARTLGVERASTEVVAFSDDDSWWAPGALTLAGRLFGRHPRLGLLAARILVGEEEADDPTSRLMAASPLEREAGAPGPRILGFLACGAVVRRSAFLEAGGFDARTFFAGEERLLAVDLARRGWQLAYVHEVVAHHHPSPLRDDRRRRRLEARNALLFAWLRRPLREALRETAGALAEAARDADTRAGVASAARSLPWALRARSPVGPALARDLARLERAEPP